MAWPVTAFALTARSNCLQGMEWKGHTISPTIVRPERRPWRFAIWSSCTSWPNKSFRRENAFPADLFVRPEEWAMERSKHPFAGAWLYPWLKQNDSVTQSKKRKGFKG